MHRIMIVDDEENILNALKRVLKKRADWEVETYTSGKEALRRAQTGIFELFLSDYRMPEMNGVEFLSQVKEVQPDSTRIILSGYTDLQALLSAINEAEIYRFISKPWNDYELIATVGQALAYRDMQVENRLLADQIREQKSQLEIRDRILEKLEAESPGITRVNWTEDGAIYLTDDEL